jgi:phosphoglucosamine mutase
MREKKRYKLFGTDGVRGRANYAPMTVEMALALGRAAGKIFRRGPGQHRIVIGKDTRLSGYMFENALIAGLCSMGVDTLMVGPLPTPGVAYITRAYRADAGIVISASHNPFHDNGIKFFTPEGFKLADTLEEEIEQVVADAAHLDVLPADDALGKNTKIEDAQGRYIEFVKSSFPRKLTLQGLKIVVDCANGACYRVGPLVFQELEATVVPHGCSPNGLNINKDCGATHPAAAAALVKQHHADVGIAFDGDGDRVVMADERGEILDGDEILAICAKEMHRREELDRPLVIGTVMTNLGVIRSLQTVGIEVSTAPVGDRYVLQEMVRLGANLGGEQSGHLIFFPYSRTGDGIVAALQVLRIMQESGRRLSEIRSWVRRFPQALINVSVKAKPPLLKLPLVGRAIEEANRSLGGEGRVLVRYSGTEPICRVMVEGEDDKLVERLAQMIAEATEVEVGL